MPRKAGGIGNRVRRSKAHQLAKQAEFLQAFSKTGNLLVASQASGVDRSRHYDWLRDPNYSAAFKIADEEATERLVEEARRRAADGYEESVVYQGERCYEHVLDKDGIQRRIPLTVRKYDSGLLMFLLKGRKPEVYRDNVRVESTNITKIDADIQIEHKVILRSLSDYQIEQLEQWLLAAPQGDGEGDGEGSSRGEEIPDEK